ncbi:MAG: cytochrome c [Proteobacteria bacterium]|nr:MAG: cytochrome c [Pseudomonadota bacterium]
MIRLATLGLAASLTFASLVAVAAEPAAPPSPAEVAKRAIETRQGLFKVIAGQWGPVAGMLRNAPFDAAVVEKSASRIEVLAGIIPEVHMADTRKDGTGVKTGALDGIWTGQADFKAKADDLAKAARELATVAKTGDQAKTKAAAGAVGKACGSCHDTYRAKQG